MAYHTQSQGNLTLTSHTAFLVAEMWIVPSLSVTACTVAMKGNICISATRNVLSDVGLMTRASCVSGMQ